MKTYTMQDWENDKSLKPKTGQFISDEVFNDLLNCLPPATWEGGIFQPGEAHIHDFKTGKALYMTFKENGVKPAKYQYIGLRTLGNR